MRKTLAACAALLAAASAGAALAQTRAASPFGTGPQESQPPADWRAGQRNSTVAPAQTPPNPAIPPNPCMTSKVQGATPPNPCTPPVSARTAAKLSAAPVIRLAPAQPAFMLAGVCQAGKPVATLRVVATNAGTVSVPPSAPAMRITAIDDTPLAWAGSVKLPALAAGASATVAIPLLPPSRPDAVAGKHRFSVMAVPLGIAAASPIEMSIPAGFCNRLTARDPKRTVLSMAHGAPAMTTAMNNTTPRGASKFAPKVDLALPAPSALTSTVDEKVCNTHGGFGGGLACAALLPQGRLALVWSWSGASADGYKVYRVDGGQHTYVGRQANGKDATLYIVDPVPAGGYTGKCYAVTAFRGTEESAPSGATCAGGGNVVSTVTLAPLDVRSLEHYRWVPRGLGGGGPYENIVDRGGVRAGYSYATQKYFSGDGYADSIYETALHFDSSAFEHKTVRAARLRLRVDTSNVGTDRHEDHVLSCATSIQIGREYWWDHRDRPVMINAVAGAHPGVYNGPDIALDVTDIVRGWAQSPGTNYGLVLAGDKTAVDVFVDDACETAFVPELTRLEVEFY
ncbi:MAG TPA: hypothetical protein VI319_15505 [Burkholderiales bacterium]